VSLLLLLLLLLSLSGLLFWPWDPGTDFGAVTVSSLPSYPFFWAPPTNFIRYNKVGDLGAPGGTTNMCLGVCGEA
jgi:hypothetical protein